MTVLVFGADPQAAEMLASSLTRGGAEAWVASSLRHAIDLAAAPPDVVAVAWDGARRDRLKLVRHLDEESSPLPILVALSHPTVDAWVRALEEGADVCVAAYQHEDELAAQCVALARRAERARAPRAAAAGPIRVEAMSPIATLRGRPVSLTSSEHVVLAQLVKRLGKVVKREDLDPYPGRFSTSALESVISRLRKKLDGFELRAIRERGYVLMPAAGRQPRETKAAKPAMKA